MDRSLSSQLKERWLSGPQRQSLTPDEQDELFFAGNVSAVTAAYLPLATSSEIAPNITVQALANAGLAAALHVEGMAGRIEDCVKLMRALQVAEEMLRQAIRTSPIWAELFRALGRNLWFQSRFDEAISAFGKGERLRDDMARAAGWPINSCLYLPRNCSEVLGLMGHLDAFAKHKILTGDPRPYYLLAPTERVVNQPFLDCWRAYITIISDPSEIAEHAPRELVYGVNWNWIMPRNGSTVFVHEGIAAVQRAWAAEHRAPLARLSEIEADLLAETRRRWGLAPNDKFVCLHVRSSGFYGTSRESSQRFRNISVDTYYPAIRMLTQQGYWVVRIGDPSMPPLDLAQCGNSGRVVDYAHSKDKSAMLDVVLCAGCDLFIGTNSGPHTIAHAFGRRACGTNHAIYPGVPWHPDDIFIAQEYHSDIHGRSLSLREILGTDVVHCDHQFHLDRLGIALIPNEPDDITETVREALSPESYHVADANKAGQVLELFDELNRAHDLGISGHLGRHFAWKHADTLVGGSNDATVVSMRRKLDFLIPIHGRSAYLHRILRTGLALDLPDAYFIVLDDASGEAEEVPGLGSVTVEEVCRSFDSPRVIHSRNPHNMGLANTLMRYYREVCNTDYTALVNPKDEFIDAKPIREALGKLDADPMLSLVVYPLRQGDSESADKLLSFHYERMTGKEFIGRHIDDANLQHCGGYAVMRVADARKAGIPRSLELRSRGLEDASGIDHDMLFRVATLGDVDFVTTPPIRRWIGDGYTQRFPLTFAYTQYQYARRLVLELGSAGWMSRRSQKTYLSFRLMLVLYGAMAVRKSYSGVLERDFSRIEKHLKMPLWIYAPLECLRFGLWPTDTMVTYYKAAFIPWLAKS